MLISNPSIAEMLAVAMTVSPCMWRFPTEGSTVVSNRLRQETRLRTNSMLSSSQAGAVVERTIRPCVDGDRGYGKHTFPAPHVDDV